MQHDRPTPAELLDIVASTLHDTVVPATEPHARHAARVAASLCAIVARELRDETSNATTMRRLELALNVPFGSGGIDAVSEHLRTTDDAGAERALGLVADLVRSKLDIAKPGYHAHDARAEADAIA